MRAFHRLRVFARSWLRPSAVDVELGEELRFHLERQVQANLDAGMPPVEARRSAHLSLGHLEGLREESRASRPGALIRQAIRDVRYGTRLLRKAPLFAVTAIVIVALGVGATTAIVSVVYGVVLRPLPYAEPARLVNIWMLAPQLALPRIQVTAADHREWQTANHVFGEIALMRALANFNLTGIGEPERLFGARVSASLFRVLGVTPAIGRGFSDDENQIGRDRVALLSDGLWRRRFGGDRAIVGRTINLSGESYTVIGVMRPDFQYPGRDTELWTPLTIDPAELESRIGNNFIAIARLKSGVSLAQAQGEMDVIAKRLADAFPATTGIITGVQVVPLLEQLIGSVRPTLFVMFGAVCCLLLIACLNLANLLSARAASRAGELAVRCALAPAVLDALRDLDPEQAVYDVRTMDDVVERSTAQRWLNMTLVSTFAAIALLLASVGVYGVIAYGVARQAREFGIRLALGARPAAITRLVLRRGALLSMGGGAIGLVLSVFLTRAMASLLYGVRPGDPLSFAAAGAVLVFIALVASYLPARRAASVDPAIALRDG